MTQENKVSLENMKAHIKSVEYRKLGERRTHCTIILDNGFEVTGESVCVDVSNFDTAIGEEIAYKEAFNKLWDLFGFQLKEKLYIQSLPVPDKLNIEFYDLLEKYNRLETMLNKGQPDFISDKAWELLQKQYKVMEEYLSLLKKRSELYYKEAVKNA